MARAREPEVASIEAVTHDGRGIAAVSGKKVFVAGALEGEEVRFIRRKRRRNFDEAELLEVLSASPERIAPRCAVFGTCGGCSMQHVSAARQREIKMGTLRDNFSRIAGVEPEQWLEPIYDDSADAGWNYRRRARLAVKDVQAKGRVLVGFRERHAPFITDMHRCEVLAAPVDDLLDPLSDLIGSLSIRQRVPQIELAVADNGSELVFRVLDPPTSDDLQRLQEFGQQRGLRISLQPGGIDSVQPLYEDPQLLRYRLPEFDVDLEFDANDFLQINQRVNERMLSRAVELLDLEPSHRVLDLFCGIGNFSLPLATRSAAVLGIEMEQRQVSRARHNAALNQLGNCEFMTADLSQIDGSESWLAAGWDRLLIDPARSGAEAVTRHMRQMGPAKLVYLSCHPGTLARDTGELVKSQDYRLVGAGIIDMFPHTAHVESIAVFEKIDKK